MAESEFTIKDIARLANVSPSTVSRYINGHFERMSPKTARLIAEIIAEHHFVPNKSAQKLKHQKSNLIGVMVANIDDSFSTELYKGAEGILKAGGYDAMLLQSNGEIQREQELIDDLHELQIDGLLLQPLQSEVAAFNELKESKMPVVFLDRFLEGRPWQDVESNNSAISAELARLIVRQQYEQVLIVSEPVGTISTRVQRVEGITSVLDEHHVAFKVLEIEQKSLNRGQIYQRIAELTNANRMSSAVKSGMSRATSAMQSAFSRMVSAAQSSTSRITSSFSKIGSAANSAASRVNSLQNAINRLHSKTIDIKVNMTGKGADKFAKGTEGTKGGPAWVNDGLGANFQEAFRLPNGKTGLFPKVKNLLVDLPRGTKIWNGDETRRLKQKGKFPHYAKGTGEGLSVDIPHYANGTGGKSKASVNVTIQNINVGGSATKQDANNIAKAVHEALQREFANAFDLA